jgi:hypothetical protein
MSLSPQGKLTERTHTMAATVSALTNQPLQILSVQGDASYATGGHPLSAAASFSSSRSSRSRLDLQQPDEPRLVFFLEDDDVEHSEASATAEPPNHAEAERHVRGAEESDEPRRLHHNDRDSPGRGHQVGPSLTSRLRLTESESGKSPVSPPHQGRPRTTTALGVLRSTMRLLGSCLVSPWWPAAASHA